MLKLFNGTFKVAFEREGDAWIAIAYVLEDEDPSDRGAFNKNYTKEVLKTLKNIGVSDNNITVKQSQSEAYPHCNIYSGFI